MLNYDQASAIGNVGERRVGDSLRTEAAVLGYRLIDNLLLIDDRTTAQLDHVIVDRFGILVVETKNYHALIKGKSDEQFWTACYSGKQRRRERFQNPLRQNDRHREMLHRVLGAFGTHLPPGYLQNLVVFAGGNISQINLDDADSMRVIPDREIVDYLRARCGDFPPNPGALDAEQVTDLISVLKSANQASNPDVIALHAENVGRATRRFGDRFRSSRPSPSPSSNTSPYGAPTIYHRGVRYPDGSQSAPARRPPASKSTFLALLAAVLVLTVGWWAFVGGGLISLANFGAVLSSRGLAGFGAETTPNGAAPAATTGVVAYDVNLALQRLTEASPEIRQRLSNASQPQLSVTNGMATYTWEYVSKSTQSSASVARISITLDSSGQIVGVTGGP